MLMVRTKELGRQVEAMSRLDRTMLKMILPADIESEERFLNGRQVRRLHGRWVRKRGVLVTAVVLGSRDRRGHE